MPQFERGLYEPGEDVRVFDGSEEEEDVEGSRLPLLIVLALLVLAMFAGFVWLAYSEGVARGRSEIPVVTAEAGPARVAPANPGGAATPYKGFKIYEQPAPPDEDAAQDVSPRTAAEAKANPASATPASAAAKPTAPAMPIAKPAAKVEAPPAKTVAPPVKAAEAAPKPAPVAKTPAPALTPKAAIATPAQPSAPLAPATAAPKQLAVNAPPAPAPGVQAPAASGAYVLQIGAYKSQAEADAAWNSYKAKHAALLAGYSPNVAQADLGDKGTWYRLRIAGFSSKDVASALCDRLKADGGGCFLGK
ncbi:MAG TPA: SPOR domain-containing protein [Rhizomicrobium sp.]|jgi:cell division protein FtsN|nr:SPOR domain-containing protein [Rhizomicrobium sp.]